jgi:hypothetical protein
MLHSTLRVVRQASICEPSRLEITEHKDETLGGRTLRFEPTLDGFRKNNGVTVHKRIGHHRARVEVAHELLAVPRLEQIAHLLLGLGQVNCRIDPSGEPTGWKLEEMVSFLHTPHRKDARSPLEPRRPVRCAHAAAYYH